MSGQNLQQREIKKVIVHCSASMFGDVSVIDEWHRERGWNGIGYHYVILNGIRKKGGEYQKELDGTIERGRSIERIGAHCKGENQDSIGICLIGMRFFSLEQIISLIGLCRDLMGKFEEIGPNDVYGHREFNSHKECPTFDIAFIRILLKLLSSGDLKNG